MPPTRNLPARYLSSHSDNRWYYAGDLGLSFDGNNSSYEYAIDFGNKARGYNTNAAIGLIANLNKTFGLDAHWTMSCGNDEIEGRSVGVQLTNVSEPGGLLLLGLGLLGLAGARRQVQAKK